MTHTSRRAETPTKMLDWNDLRIAFVVAGGGPLAGAARLLQMQRATVWRRIDALTTALSLLTQSGPRRTARVRVFMQHLGHAMGLQRSSAGQP